MITVLYVGWIKRSGSTGVAKLIHYVLCENSGFARLDPLYNINTSLNLKSLDIDFRVSLRVIHVSTLNRDLLQFTFRETFLNKPVCGMRG